MSFIDSLFGFASAAVTTVNDSPALSTLAVNLLSDSGASPAVKSNQDIINPVSNTGVIALNNKIISGGMPTGNPQDDQTVKSTVPAWLILALLAAAYFIFGKKR